MQPTTSRTLTKSLEALEFENMNYVGRGLNYLQETSPEKLLELIKSIKQPLKIVTIYPYGSLHIAWVLTQAKIVRKKGK